MQRVAMVARPATRCAAAVLVAVVLGACTAGPGPSRSASTSRTATTTATATPTGVMPSAAATPTAAVPTPSTIPSAPPAPTAIVLSAAGIGDIAMGTAHAVPALIALLGPPSGTGEPEPDACGPGNTAGLMWPDLTVHLDTSAGDALWGWELRGSHGPAGATTASGVTVGAPLADASALPGATAPFYLESMDTQVVQADGVAYWGTGADPATATIHSVAVNAITCD